MKLVKSLRVMLVLTGLTLIYVYMQMEIISLAYEGKRKEKQIMELNTKNGVVAYKILQLKSANHLGENLLNENSSLHFQDTRSVVELVSRESIVPADAQVPAVAPQRPNPFLSLFIKAPAEARAEDKDETLKPWRKSR